MGMDTRPISFQIRTLMFVIAIVAVALAAGILVAPWWQHHQCIEG
jgi:hypothetical protein